MMYYFNKGVKATTIEEIIKTTLISHQKNKQKTEIPKNYVVHYVVHLRTKEWDAISNTSTFNTSLSLLKSHYINTIEFISIYSHRISGVSTNTLYFINRNMELLSNYDGEMELFAMNDWIVSNLRGATKRKFFYGWDDFHSNHLSVLRKSSSVEFLVVLKTNLVSPGHLFGSSVFKLFNMASNLFLEIDFVVVFDEKEEFGFENTCLVDEYDGSGFGEFYFYTIHQFKYVQYERDFLIADYIGFNFDEEKNDFFDWIFVNSLDSNRLLFDFFPEKFFELRTKVEKGYEERSKFVILFSIFSKQVDNSSFGELIAQRENLKFQFIRLASMEKDNFLFFYAGNSSLFFSKLSQFSLNKVPDGNGNFLFLIDVLGKRHHYCVDCVKGNMLSLKNTLSFLSMKNIPVRDSRNVSNSIMKTRLENNKVKSLCLADLRDSVFRNQSLVGDYVVYFYNNVCPHCFFYEEILFRHCEGDKLQCIGIDCSNENCNNIRDIHSSIVVDYLPKVFLYNGNKGILSDSKDFSSVNDFILLLNR